MVSNFTVHIKLGVYWWRQILLLVIWIYAQVVFILMISGKFWSTSWIYSDVLSFTDTDVIKMTALIIGFILYIQIGVSWWSQFYYSWIWIFAHRSKITSSWLHADDFKLNLIIKLDLFWCFQILQILIASNWVSSSSWIYIDTFNFTLLTK